MLKCSDWFAWVSVIHSKHIPKPCVNWFKKQVSNRYKLRANWPQTASDHKLETSLFFASDSIKSILLTNFADHCNADGLF